MSRPPDMPFHDPSAPPRWFTAEQQAVVRSCLADAERCLERFYRFSPREWFHYSYALLTACDLPAGFPPRPVNVFGEILKHPERAAADGSSGAHASYSIVLFDGNILRHLDEHREVSFRHLLLYVLAHELVHIARFHHVQPFELPDEQKEDEERTVHTITGRILAELGDAQLLRLTEIYLSGEYSL